MAEEAERSSRQSVLEATLANRPENTSNAYKSKQNEFIIRCQNNPLYEHERVPELVNGGKLLLFLNAQDGRASRKRRRVDVEGAAIGIRMYEGYVNAIVDLWKQQVFPSDRKTTKALNDKTHNELVSKMLQKANVTSKAKTHISRGCSARMAELQGLDEEQIRRLGHWASGAMERHYLSALPRKGMRVMAGFSPRENSYYLKRDCLEPSEV